MDKPSDAYPIECIQYTAGGLNYDLIVFRLGAAYYAAWYCRRCLTRTETVTNKEWNAAKEDAQDAIGAHHFDKHTRGKPPLASRN